MSFRNQILHSRFRQGQGLRREDSHPSIMRLLSRHSWYAILNSLSPPSFNFFHTSSLPSSLILSHRSSTISWSTTPSPSTHSRRRPPGVGVGFAAVGCCCCCSCSDESAVRIVASSTVFSSRGVNGPSPRASEGVSVPVGVLGSSPPLTLPSPSLSLPRSRRAGTAAPNPAPGPAPAAAADECPCSTCSNSGFPSFGPTPRHSSVSTRGGPPNGGKRYFGKSFWNQGSCRISWSLMRLFESTVSIRERSERASEDRNGGSEKMPPGAQRPRVSLGRERRASEMKRTRTVDLFEQERNMVVVKRQPSAEHDVKDHTARPDVDFGSCIESECARVSNVSRIFDGYDCQ